MQKLSLRIGFALALGASITGCAVGPNYRRQPVKLQPFHNAPSIETRTASMPAPPLDQWWTGFRDPELTRIVQRALDQNLDLAAAMARVQQARAAARGAGAQRLPSGNLSASTTTLYQSTESTTGRLASHLPGYTPHSSEHNQARAIDRIVQKPPPVYKIAEHLTEYILINEEYLEVTSGRSECTKDKAKIKRNT